MAKSHTDETDQFNDFITRYGNYKRFSADKIHSEKEIKWLFDYYFLRLEDETFSYKVFKSKLKAYYKKNYDKYPSVPMDNNFDKDKSKSEGNAYNASHFQDP